MRKLFALLSLVLAFIAPSKAFAYDWYVSSAQIYWVEATYMPSVIVFTINVAAGTCASNASLTYTAPNADNAKSIYGALLAARVSGTQIRMYGNNSGCAVTNVLFG